LRWKVLSLFPCQSKIVKKPKSCKHFSKTFTAHYPKFYSLKILANYLCIHGHPYLEGIIKVNVDVSSFGNPDNADFEGILKNDMRIWIQGFYGSCGRASN
jgi:hypothetical protein